MARIKHKLMHHSNWMKPNVNNYNPKQASNLCSKRIYSSIGRHRFRNKTNFNSKRNVINKCLANSRQNFTKNKIRSSKIKAYVGSNSSWIIR